MTEAENLLDSEIVKDSQINENVLKSIPNLKEVSELAERLDFYDVIILKKFYLVGKDSFPNTKPYCFPILYKEMKELHKMKIGMEALRKRLKVLCKLGLLVQVNNSNPSVYFPVPEKEIFVKAVITKFFLINGITKFV
jgi:hypothetical protein